MKENYKVYHCFVAYPISAHRRSQWQAFILSNMMDSDSDDERAPLSPRRSPSPDEMDPSRCEAEYGKPSRIRKFFCSQTGLFVVLGLMLLAVVTVLLITGLVVPNVINDQQHALPSDPLERARALLKQSPLIDG